MGKMTAQIPPQQPMIKICYVVYQSIFAATAVAAHAHKA